VIRTLKMRRFNTAAKHAEDQREHKNDNRTPANDHDAQSEKHRNNQIVPK
jgi:hypothetical protein